jgi:predicted DNA-binding protein (UPF0251 family)
MYVIKSCISEKNRIKYISKNCEELHLTKPFSKNDSLKIIKRCTKLKLITYSKSTKERLSAETLKIIKYNKIRTFTKKEQGRPINIDIEKLKKIIKMYKDYSYRELAKKLNVPKSTIHYLIKYSKRKKIKEGNKIIYLK